MTTQSGNSPVPLQVLVATPLGKGGNGGIDRLMDLLRDRYEMSGDREAVIRFASTRGKGHILLSPVYLAAFLFRMALLKLTGRLDILHINLSSQGSFSRKRIVARFAMMLGVPYVLHLHGSRFREFYESASPGKQQAIRETFVNARAAIVLGSYWREFVSGMDGRINTVILHNATAPLDVPIKANSPGEVHVAFLGALGARKGVPELVEAARRLADLPGWKMTIAGNGEVEETRKVVAEHGLGDRIAIPGWLGPQDSAALLGTCDVVVLPSYNENLPMSVIEGMGAGKAVVTTPVGAVLDIISDEDNGLIVQPGNVEELTAALKRVIEDGELRRKLGENARSTHREMLDISTYLQRLTAIWKEALSNASANKQQNLNT